MHKWHIYSTNRFVGHLAPFFAGHFAKFSDGDTGLFLFDFLAILIQPDEVRWLRSFGRIWVFFGFLLTFSHSWFTLAI